MRIIARLTASFERTRTEVEEFLYSLSDLITEKNLSITSVRFTLIIPVDHFFREKLQALAEQRIDYTYVYDIECEESELTDENIFLVSCPDDIEKIGAEAWKLGTRFRKRMIANDYFHLEQENDLHLNTSKLIKKTEVIFNSINPAKKTGDFCVVTKSTADDLLQYGAEGINFHDIVHVGNNESPFPMKQLIVHNTLPAKVEWPHLVQLEDLPVPEGIESLIDPICYRRSSFKVHDFQMTKEYFHIGQKGVQRMLLISNRVRKMILTKGLPMYFRPVFYTD